LEQAKRLFKVFFSARLRTTSSG